MKPKVGALIVVALGVWGMKRYYADARPDDLWWILSPTAHLAGLVTGVRFAMSPGEGYVALDRLFLIEKSCAGINFMIAAFGMVSFALIHRVTSTSSAARVIGVGLLVSYTAAIVVNATRIAIALWLGAHPIARTSVSAAQLHRIEGIVVYFGGLMMLYQLVRRFDRHVAPAWSDWALPLACYYAVTIVIPLANGAAEVGPAFAAHVAVVLVLPPLIIAATTAVRTPWPRACSARRGGMHGQRT
jgi:exosortase K